MQQPAVLTGTKMICFLNWLWKVDPLPEGLWACVWNIENRYNNTQEKEISSQSWLPRKEPSGLYQCSPVGLRKAACLSCSPGAAMRGGRGRSTLEPLCELRVFGFVGFLNQCHEFLSCFTIFKHDFCFWRTLHLRNIFKESYSVKFFQLSEKLEILINLTFNCNISLKYLTSSLYKYILIYFLVHREI